MTQSASSVCRPCDNKDDRIRDLEDRLEKKSRRYPVREEKVVEIALKYGKQDESTKAIEFTPEKLDEFVRDILSKAIRGY